MGFIRYISALIVVIIVGAWVVFNILVINIDVGYVGVRTQEYAILGSKGVVQEDFNPGWHRDLGPIDSWVIFDSTVQTLEMTRTPSRGDRKGRDDIQVQSADGYAVSIDVTVKYRIMPGKAHKVYENTGSGNKYKEIVRTEAQQVCVGLLGKMKTEDFYNPAKRRIKSVEVKQILAESLADNYIVVIDVLMRDVQFDPGYENKIRNKKLADQEVEYNKSKGRAAEMSGVTQVVEAETIKKVNIIAKEKEAALIGMQAQAHREIAKITAEADKYATEKKADADLIRAENEAKGNLLVKQSEAKGEELRNEAMRGVGGSTIVALEAARNITLDNILISTIETDLLDIDAMATRFGVPESK